MIQLVCIREVCQIFRHHISISRGKMTKLSANKVRGHVIDISQGLWLGKNVRISL
jgi:hypothetical protein